jgi:hypothetical protein
MRAASSPRAGHGQHQARDVAQRADRVVVVEVAAEALLVAEALDAHDHRVRELALGEEGERAGLAAQLVERVVEVGEVLDLGSGTKPSCAVPCARPRIVVSSSSVSKTRPMPKRFCRPCVTP